MINTSIFEEFPVIRTNRLTLRDIRMADSAQIFEMRSSNRVNQFIARTQMLSESDSLNLIEKTQQAYHNKQGIGWAGILRNSNTIIGTCGFNTIDYANHRAEIGGEMAVEYWGKNMAVEAVTSIVKFGLEHMNLHSIEAKVSPNNRGAIYLLESMGFKKEGQLRERIYFNGTYSDMALYGLVKGQETLSVI